MEKGNYKIQFIVDTEKAEKSVKDFDSDLEEFAGKDQKRSKILEAKKQSDRAKSVKEQKKANKKLTKAITKEHQKRMASFKGNQKKQTQEHDRHLKMMLNAEKDHAKKIASLRSQTAGGRAKTKMKEGFESGGIMGALKAVPGVAKIGAVVAGGLALATKALVSMGIEASKVNHIIKGTGKILQLSADELAIYRSELLSIRRPADMSAEAIARIGSAVANIPNVDKSNIAGITEQILNLQRLEPGASIDKIIGAVGRLGSAIGDNEKAMDSIAVLAGAFKGKVADPLDEALTELAVVYSKASTVYEDQEKAMRDSAGLLAALVETGVEVSEATTQAEELMLKLNDIANDPKIRKGIFDAMPAGFENLKEKMAAGKVGAIEFIQELEKMGDEGDKVAYAIGSTAGEGVQALLKSFKVGEKSIGEFAAKFDDVGGAAERMAKDMVSPLQVAQEQVSTSWGNMLLNVGSASTGLVTSVTQATASALGWIAGLFETSEQAFTKASEKGQRFTQIGYEIDGALQVVSADMEHLELLAASGQLESKFEIFRQQLDAIGEVSPYIAQQMSAILDHKGNKTIADFERLNELLLQTQGIASNLAFANQFEASKLALESMEEKLGDMADELRMSSATGNEAVEIFYLQEKSLGFVKMHLKAINKQLAMEGLSAKQVSDLTERQSEYMDEQSVILASQAKARAILEETVKRDMEFQISEAKRLGKEISKEEVALRIRNKLNEKFGFQIKKDSVVYGEVTKALKVNSGLIDMVSKAEDKKRISAMQSLDAVQDEIVASKKLLSNTEDISDEEKNRLDALVETLEAQAESLALQELELDLKDGLITILGEEFDWATATNAEKIKALEMQKAQIDGEIQLALVAITGLEAIIAGNSTEAEIKSNILEIQNEINKAEGVQVRAVNISAKNAQFQLDMMKEGLGILQAQSDALGVKIGTLGTAGVKPTRGARGAARAGRGRDREAEKARKEEQKAQEKETKRQNEYLEQKKAQQKREQVLAKEKADFDKKILDINMKLQEERIKINAELRDAQKEFTDENIKAMNSFIAGIRETQKAFGIEISSAAIDAGKSLRAGLADPIIDVFGRILDAENKARQLTNEKMRERAFDYNESVKELEDDRAKQDTRLQEARKEAFENTIKAQQAYSKAQFGMMLASGKSDAIEKITDINLRKNNLEIMSRVLRAIKEDLIERGGEKEIEDLSTAEFAAAVDRIGPIVAEQMGKDKASQVALFKDGFAYALGEFEGKLIEFKDPEGRVLKTGETELLSKRFGTLAQVQEELNLGVRELAKKLHILPLQEFTKGKDYQTIQDQIEISSKLVDAAGIFVKQAMKTQSDIVGLRKRGVSADVIEQKAMQGADIAFGTAESPLSDIDAISQGIAMDKAEKAVGVFAVITSKMEDTRGEMLELIKVMDAVGSEIFETSGEFINLSESYIDALQVGTVDEFINRLDDMKSTLSELAPEGVDTLISNMSDRLKLYADEITSLEEDQLKFAVDIANKSAEYNDSEKKAFDAMISGDLLAAEADQEKLKAYEQHLKDLKTMENLYQKNDDIIKETKIDYDLLTQASIEQAKVATTASIVNNEAQEKSMILYFKQRTALKGIQTELDAINDKLTDQAKYDALDVFKSSVDEINEKLVQENLLLDNQVESIEKQIKEAEELLKIQKDPEIIKEYKELIALRKKELAALKKEKELLNDTAVIEQRVVDLRKDKIEKVKTELTELSKGFDKVESYGKAISGIFDVINGDSADLAENIFNAGSGVADFAGKLSGLPIGPVFEGIKGIFDVFKKLADLQTQGDKDGIDALIEQLALVDLLIEKEERRLDVQRKQFDIYVAMNDEAKEQIEIAEITAAASIETAKEFFDAFSRYAYGNQVMSQFQLDILQMAGEMEGVEELFDDFGNAVLSGADATYVLGRALGKMSPQELIDFYENLNNKIAENEALIETNIQLNEDQESKWKSSSKDAMRARDNINEGLQAQIDAMQGISDETENLIDIAGGLDDLQRAAIRDKMADTKHAYETERHEIMMTMEAGEERDKALADLDKRNADERITNAQELFDIAKKHFEDGLITLAEFRDIELDLFNAEEARLELNKEITDEKDEQSELSEKELAELREMHQLRQQMILGGGADPEAIAAVESQIIAKMIAAGATDEAVQDTKDSFAAASYDVGSPYIPSDQMAMVHKGERIFTASENIDMIDAMNRISSMPSIEELVAPVVNRYMNSMAELGAVGRGGGSVTYTIGDIIVNVPDGVTDPQEIAQAMYDMLPDWHDEQHEANGTSNGR